MTKKIAKEVFDILFSTIQENGLSDIGTFLIDEVQSEQQFSYFDDKYEYVDTEQAIANLRVLADSPEGSLYALEKLVNASLEYFNLAYKLPNKYAAMIMNLGFIEEIPEINLNTLNDETINLSLALRSEPVIETIKFLGIIRNGLNQSDEVFLNHF